jgi:hypothetical protein
MKAQMSVTVYPPPGERFAPGCFDGSVGRLVPVVVLGDIAGEGTLRSYEVSSDGLTASMDLDVELGHDPNNWKAPT